MEDLLARWTSPAWEQEVDAWVEDVLAGTGASVVTAPVTVRARFWSVVRRYPTTAGTVFAKECNPGQAFEGPLLEALDELEPGGFARPVAVDARHGRFLLADAGRVHDRSAGPVPEGELRQVLLAQGQVQRRLARHRDRLLAAGLPTLLPEEVPDWFERTADHLASLPRDDVQHIGPATHRRLVAGLGGVRRWCAVLADSPVPATFQHNDLNPGNVARRGQRVVSLDVGDAFWSHPFAVLQLPLAMSTGTWPWGPPPSDPSVVGHVEAYLAGWAGAAAPVEELRRLVVPALRLAQAHRGESWRRLLAHVPGDRLGAEPPLLHRHLQALTG